MMFVTIVSCCGRWCVCVFDPIYSGGSEFKITAAAAAGDGAHMLLVVCSVLSSLCASFSSFSCWRGVAQRCRENWSEAGDVQNSKLWVCIIGS